MMKYLLSLLVCILLLSNCFEATTQKSKPKATIHTKKDYTEDGKKIAYTTFTTLSGNLQRAMKEGGVSNAIKYCNLAATTLVDSLEQMHNVKIKRTSLKIRNQNNKPTTAELAQLHTYQKQFESKEELKPTLQQLENGMAFYAPIHLMDLCQKCHGKVGESLKSEDYVVIKDLYPDDQAINFMAGDLRGMWSITFKE